MSQLAVKYQGVTATEKYLYIHFTIGEQAAMRFHQVRVPLQHLLHADVTNALDTLVRRRLIQVWSEVDLADPLF